MGRERLRFLLLYGSQTGNAEAISEEMVEKAAAVGLIAERYSLNETDKKFNIERETCVVIVTSTTGEGDPPDNATKFYQRIKKRTLPNDFLSQVNVAVLGLGDSNYSNFCNCGKNIRRFLLDLGAKEFYPAGWADDATGLEIVVEPWLDGLWAPLRATLESLAAKTTTCDSVVTDDKADGDVAANGDHSPQNGLFENTVSLYDKQSNDETATNISNGNDMNDGGVPPSDLSVSTCGNSCHDSTDSTAVETDDPCPVHSHNCQLCYPENSLNDLDLTIPLQSPSYLCIKYGDEIISTESLPILNGMRLPSSASDVVMATVTRATQLTSDKAVKKALEIELCIEDGAFKYVAGDSFGIVCRNEPDEVQAFIERLGLSDVADATYVLSIDGATKKRAPALPKHVPARATLRHVFAYCCDIRAVPKKALLRLLVEHTALPRHKRRLQELCSKEGQDYYARCLRQPNLCLADILSHFTSCQPPIASLLEHLTPLQPRPYSACSSPSGQPERLSFVFNVVEIARADGRAVARNGVCTGWLDSITKTRQKRDGSCLEGRMAETNLNEETLEKITLPVFLRTSHGFHLPDDSSTRVIMIGPGTGVAPFVGFLRERQHLRRSVTNACIGQMWLYYGCRHKDRDHLFRDELNSYHESGLLTDLSICYSRDHADENEPKYVQDLLQLRKDTLVEWLDDDAQVYVCGDARNMAKDVFETFVKIVGQVRSWSEKESRAYMMTKKLKRMYHEDVWT